MATNLSLLLAFLIFLTLGILIASRQQLEDRRLLIKFFVLGFLLRVAVAIGIYLYLSIQGHENGFFPHPDQPFYRDDWIYDSFGWEIAESWRTGQNYSLPSHQNPGYFYTGGIVYFLFGHNTFIVRIVNCFFSALTISYIYLLAKELWDRKVARVSASLALFFPSFFIISALQWKDTILTFLVTFCVWNITILKKKLSNHRIVLLMGAIIYAFLIRKQTGMFLAFLAILYMLIDLRRLKFKHIIIALLVFIAVGMFFNEVREFGFLGQDYLYNLEDTLYSYRERAFNRDVSAGLKGIVLVKMFGGNLLSRLALFPISVGMMLLHPIPLPHLVEYGSKIFIPGMWIWYLWFPFFTYGFIYTLKKKAVESSHIIITIIYVVVSFLATGMLASGLVRYRLQMMPFAMILIAVGMLNFKKWRVFYYMILLGILIIILIYGIIMMLGGSIGAIMRSLL